MRRLSKLARLPRGEVALLLQATGLLVGIRLGFSLVPFTTLRKILANLAAPERARRTVAIDTNAAAAEAIWAVETVGRQFPAVGTCLIQALAVPAFTLFKRRRRRDIPREAHRLRPT